MLIVKKATSVVPCIFTLYTSASGFWFDFFFFHCATNSQCGTILLSSLWLSTSFLETYMVEGDRLHHISMLCQRGGREGGGGEGGRDGERERYLWWYRWKYLPFFIYNMAIFIYIKVDFVTFKVEWLCWTSYSFFGGVVILDSL